MEDSEETESGQAATTHPWDGFVVGPENALAHAGVLALAKGEEDGLSPLVLHGPSGAGKSRLLEALVGETLTRRPGAAVAHLAAEEFAQRCAEAARKTGGWAELRERFRGLDLLVIDDLHHLQNAPMALNELTNTLDAIEDVGGSVAVSARTGPGQWSLEDWPRRLVNRLIGGLAVRVDWPGLESRRRYVLEQARRRRMTLAAEAVDALAEAAEGYRQIDGGLARLALSAQVERRPSSRQSVLDGLSQDGGPKPVDARIQPMTQRVARRFGVRVKDLRGPSRRKALVEPRHLAMYLAREQTGLSYASIGAYFGGRDPATVRHAIKAASLRLAADPALAAAVGNREDIR